MQRTLKKSVSLGKTTGVDESCAHTVHERLKAGKSRQMLRKREQMKARGA
jgi:hypothetical protein